MIFVYQGHHIHYDRQASSLTRVTSVKSIEHVEGLVFLPFALETLGGFHPGAVTQVKLLASSLARSKGSDEREATSQLFGRLSLILMRGNAMVLSSRHQDEEIPPQVDGVE